MFLRCASPVFGRYGGVAVGIQLAWREWSSARAHADESATGEKALKGYLEVGKLPTRHRIHRRLQTIQSLARLSHGGVYQPAPM